MTFQAYSARIAKRLMTIVFFMAAFCFSAAPIRVDAGSAPDTIPNLNTFIETVQDGNAFTLRGIYIAGVMAYPIIQQPKNDSRFISAQPAMVTEFNMAARVGNIGLLAHNTLAGRAFQSIEKDDRIVVIYGDGHTQTFAVEAILKYQALPRGLYQDLETKKKLNTGELFNNVYGGDYRLTLQTCLENKDDVNWGRLFVIAKPALDLKEMPTLALQDETLTPLSIGWPLRTRDVKPETNALR